MDNAKKSRDIKIKTVEKALTLLEILAEQNVSLPLTRLTQLSKISLSTCYRLMNTLWRNGFVERDNATDCYKLGFKAFLIGNAALQNIDLRPIAMPYLKQLAEVCDESIFLAILFGQNVTYLENVKKSDSIQVGIQTGVPIPACYTSSGKLLLANLPISEQKALTEIYLSNRQINDKEKFLDELKSIKSQDFCSGVSGLGGTIEISAPIYNYLKACVGTISIFRLTNNTETKNVLCLIKKTSIEISRAIGCVSFT